MKAPGSWTPVQYLWKSRVPLVAVPVLIGLQNWHAEHPDVTDLTALGGRNILLEVLLLLGLALGTGYLRLPFSITWWLVLLAAYAIQTRFLLGVATVLSLSVLLTWYGLRFQHAAAISALWAGAPMTSRWCRVAWQLWDLCVHLWPAVMMIYSHGPSLGWSAPASSGVVTPLSALVALPMSLTWLCGLSLGLTKDEIRGGDLSLSRHAYRVSSELPQEAWIFVHASHGIVCLTWILALLLPGIALGVTGLFILMGIVKQPFTTAWWCIFATCMWFNYGPTQWRSVEEAANLKLLEGLCCICAATMSLGFYGAQVFSPWAFRSMVLNWAVRPLARWFPSISKALLGAVETEIFWILARLGDSMLHLIPSILAVCLFHSSVTVLSAAVAMPLNLVWLYSAGARSLEATNELYGVEPHLASGTLHFVYGSHWMVCTGVAAWCLCH